MTPYDRSRATLRTIADDHEATPTREGIRQPEQEIPTREGMPRADDVDTRKGLEQASDAEVPTREGPEAVAAAAPATLSSLEMPEAIGRFEVLRKLGAGGMAVVYEAFDPELQRRVAVKLLRPSRAGGESTTLRRQRLVREAQAMARLSHPNVVTVYEVGEFGEQVFVAMEFVEGQTLREWLRARKRGVDEVLESFLQAGRGLQAAHEAALVHRDFKPENVLVGNDGRVRVMDLGLARLTGRWRDEELPPAETPVITDDEPIDQLSAALTHAGAIMGTPLYMAPEQHLGEEVDARTDQFAFCVALHEALYGTRPFSGRTYEDLVANVLAGNLWQPPKGTEIPTWLRRIVLRGLTFDPEERFSTMAALLEDILDGQAYEEASQGWAQAEIEGAWAAHARGDRIEARAKLRGALERSDSSLARALWWTLRREPMLWRRPITAGHALAADESGTVLYANAGATVQVLDLETANLRVLRGHGDRVYGLALSPDGSRLAYCDGSGEVGTWNLVDSLRVPFGKHAGAAMVAVFLDGGAMLATAGTDAIVRLWETASGRSLGTLEGHFGPIIDLAANVGGRRLLSVDTEGTVMIWEVPGTTPLHRLTPGGTHTKPFVALSPSGRRLACPTAERHEFALWELDDRGTPPHRLAVFDGHEDEVSSATFASEDFLHTAAYDGTVRTWDLVGRRSIRVLRGHGQLKSICLTRGGTRLAATGEDELALWDTTLDGEEERAAGHTASVNALAFHPSGTLLASGGHDRAIKIWNVGLGTEGKSLAGHSEPVTALAFSPDGRSLASGSYDRSVRVWDAVSGGERRQLLGHQAGISGLCFVDGSNGLVSTSWDSTLRRWDLASGSERDARRYSDIPLALAASPDHLRLLLGSIATRLTLIDPSSADADIELESDERGIFGVAWSADGTKVAWGGSSGTIRVRDLASGDVAALPCVASSIGRLDFSPDGRFVGGGFTDGVPRIFELDTGRMTELHGHVGEAFPFAFSPDGRFAASGADDGTVRLWETANGRAVWRGTCLLRSLHAHTHLGWKAIEAGDPEPPPCAWRTAIEAEARFAIEAGDFLYLERCDGTLEVWEVATDRVRHTGTTSPTDALIAVDDRALALSRRSLVMWTVDGPQWSLPDVEAFGLDDDVVLVARHGEVWSVDDDGQLQAHAPGSAGVSTLTGIGDSLLFGFDDGSIEAVTRDGEQPGQRRVFESTPTGRVLRLLAGPAHTVVAGFASGVIGLWNLADGKCLYRTKLHGRIRHLTRVGAQLHALSDLGDLVVLDLSVFERSHAEVLEEIWARIPIVWSHGMALLRPPPENHPLAPDRDP